MSYLDNIPTNWEVTTIDKEAIVVTDYVANGSFASLKENVTYLNGEGYARLIRLTDHNRKYNGEGIYVNEHSYKFLKKSKIEPNDIIISNVGEYSGTVFKAPDLKMPMTLGPNSILVKFKDSQDFMFYFLQSSIGQHLINTVKSGSANPKFNKTEFKKIEFIIPPPIEQKSIAAILTAFDDKIELLQAQNKTLEETAQTIFKEWFGKYQIGDELPEGWREGNVNEFIETSLGGDYGRENIEDDYDQKTLCLRGTDLPDMKMGIPKKAPIRYLKKSKLQKCKLENGDIVIEISGGTENQSTGRVMYINEIILESSDLPMTCVNFCRIIRPLKIEYSYFLHSLFDYLYNRKVFFNWENGTTGIKNLNLSAFLDGFKLAIPNDIEKVIEFNDSINSYFIKIQTNNSQIQTLTQTRDALLPKLMSGEIRVKM